MMAPNLPSGGRIEALAVVLFVLIGASAQPLEAQSTGSVTGTITTAAQGQTVAGVTVAITGSRFSVTSDAHGQYAIAGVPAGRYELVFRGLGYRLERRTADVAVGQSVVVDVELALEPVQLGAVTVEGASRVPVRIAEAPAAIAVVDRRTSVDLSITGQAPTALSGLPGVDVVQSDVHDFNVNARGFNSSLNRRMLVVQDGRDLSVPLLGFQEWNAMSSPLADLSKIEVVRGPGAALYGANAYNGVVNIRTPPARDVVGGKITLAGGDMRSLHGDVRFAGLAGDGRFGYKVNAGHNRSDSWTRARTSVDRGDLRREYGDLTEAVPLVLEAVPLFGQRTDPTTGAAIGRPDPVTSSYGSARLDVYSSRSIATAEVGATLLENTTLVSGVGRIQTDRTLRPWARIAWDRDDLSISAWYSGRSTLDSPHRSLGSGGQIIDHSTMLQVEVQTNRRFADERGRIVAGASARNTRSDTELTLVGPEDDRRSDRYGSVYGQVEFNLIEPLALVGALRYDAGTLFDPQLSPRLALVYTPDDRHSFRFTAHRAFQTPSQLELFLRLPAGRPANFSALEAGLRASPLGPALAAVPVGTLFTTSAAVPVLGLGNAALNVESTNSFELGYRGQLGALFLSVEGFYGRLFDFVTDLLPGANPAYPRWTAPPQVPVSAHGPLEQAVRDQLVRAGQALAAAGLARLPDGATAIVLSYANAGRATESGIEIGAGLPLRAGLELDGSYTYFDFTVDDASLLPGDVIKPNTPRHKGTVSAQYARSGLDAGVTATFVSRFDWSAGVFTGPVPARQSIDARIGYYLRPDLRVHAIATNLFNQRRYQMFGGSIVGRRLLAGATLAL